MKIDEIQCIKELRNGSYQAFTQIYEAYADRLYSFVLKQLKIVPWHRILFRIPFYAYGTTVTSWIASAICKPFIFTIAKHQVIDYFRKQVNELQFEDFMEYCENQATDVSPEDILLYDEFLQQLQQSKKVLSQREHEIYELSREKHIPIKQIAEQLDLSEQTVKKLSDFRPEDSSQRNDEI